MKQALQQVAQLWRELGLNQRVTLAVSALAVVVGMIALIFWANRPQMRLLYGKLGEKEASEVVSALQAQGVKYELGAGGTSVLVNADEVYKLRMDLASKGIPAADGIGFEIFDKTNFGISDFVQRTNFSRALQGELARTVGQLKGVRSARVMIVLPENRLLLKTAESRATASVFVDTGGLTLDVGAVNAIRSLVSNAVEGLKLDDVAVIDAKGNVLSEELKSDPMLGSASSQIKFRKQTEDYLSSKVETMLAKVLGPGNAVVRVSAEINTEAATVTEEKFDPESQVARSETVTEDSSITNERSSKSSAAGVTANIPGEQAQDAAGPSKNSEENRKVKTQQFEINRSTTNIVKNPGSINRVTAAVFISARAAAENAQSTSRTPEELNSLRMMVVNALGINAPKPGELEKIVTIQEVAFHAPAEDSGISAEKLGGWAESARPIGAVLLAGLIFFAFLGMLKRTKPEEIKFEIVEPEIPVQDQPKLRDVRISPEMLNDLIRQKPDNVGATLRHWLSEKEMM